MNRLYLFIFLHLIIQFVFLNTYKAKMLKYCLIGIFVLFICSVACNLFISFIYYLLTVHLSLILFELYIC